MNQKERRIVSYHEVGHALISALQKNSEPVQKITIVPRTMGALGYVMQVPEDEKFLQTKDEIIDDIIVTLGGRAAEEVIFNTVTTGAENDIEKATSMARSMITMFGMSEKFGLMQLESIQNRYLDGNRILNCSDQTAAEVDVEVKNLLAECYDRAKQIIRDHLDAMDKIAQFLIEKETITGKEFMKIYREVENIPEPTEEELAQLAFGWNVVKHVKSNAIVLVKNGMTVGVGAGQMNRVGAARIAIAQAGEKAKGAVLASDAFFPMGDTLELAAAAGITAVIQPGGSIRDEESVKVANEHGIAMVMTGVRHFKH